MPARRRLRLFLRLGDEDFAIRPIPGRNLVPPPELTGDAPGLDVLQPVEIGLLPVVGDEARLSLPHRLQRRAGQRFCVHIPLIGQPGLHRHAAAVAMGHHVDMILDPFQQAEFVHARDDPFARLETVKAVQLEGFGQFVRRLHAAQEILVVLQQQGGVGVQNVDHRQTVALAHLEVVEVVRRGDLHRAGAGFGIGVLVGDDGDAPAHQRQDDVLADDVLVALIVRVDGHGGVAQHGFRPCGGHDDMAALLAFHRVFEMPQMALRLGGHHLQIGDGGVQARIPVDQPLVLVDQALAVELDEDLAHGAREALVHGEALARPVAGGAKAAQLVDDGGARFLLPFPDAADELLAPQLPAGGLVFGGQLALDDHLRGDAGVIGARLPEHVLAAHALETHHDVLNGVVQGMAHVQRAGDIRRRDDDGIGLRLRVARRPEGPGLFPLLVDALFGLGRIEMLVEHEGLAGLAARAPLHGIAPVRTGFAPV